MGAYFTCLRNCKEIRLTRVSEPQGWWKKMMSEKELEPANVVFKVRMRSLTFTLIIWEGIRVGF